MSNFCCLANRTAVVTGASSGIGRATALEFARAGAKVIIHFSRSSVAAEALAMEISLLGQQAEVVQADFSESNSLEHFVDKIWTQFRSVDIWVNNAGTDVLTGAAADLTYEQKLHRLLDVDVRASMILAKTIGQRMFENGSGSILCIGWDQADRGMEGNSGELFAATKNAIMGFSRSIALSLAPKVRVNCIAPGWIKTAWGESASESWQQRVMRETPLQRWGLPEDIARTARFLCSDDASYITGQVINVNGGAVR